MREDADYTYPFYKEGVILVTPATKRKWFGFLITERRIIVAFSRAREREIIVGNIDMKRPPGEMAGKGC